MGGFEGGEGNEFKGGTATSGSGTGDTSGGNINFGNSSTGISSNMLMLAGAALAAIYLLKK